MLSQCESQLATAGIFFVSDGSIDRLHGAAVGVAAHDDVRHREGLHRVLDGAGLARRDARRRHDVAGVAQDEQVAGKRLRDQVRVDARVRAGDEEGFRLLPLHEPPEEVALRAEHAALEAMDALDEVSHGSPSVMTR